MARKRRPMGGIDRLASGRYRVRVTDPATGERVSLGTRATKADAEHAFARAVTEQARGTWVRPDNAAVPLEDYAPQWLDARLGRDGAPLRPRVRELYEGQLRLHILPTLGRVPLGRLRPATVRSWYASLLADGPGASTTAKCYRLLRAILNTAIADGLLATNPCAIRGAGVEKTPERSLPTVDQVFDLADGVQPRYRALVLVAAFSGLRRGELFGLRRQDVDLEHHTVSVTSQRQQLANGELIIGPPKSEAGRRMVALPDEAFGPLPHRPLVPAGRPPLPTRHDESRRRHRQRHLEGHPQRTHGWRWGPRPGLIWPSGQGKRQIRGRFQGQVTPPVFS